MIPKMTMEEMENLSNKDFLSLISNMKILSQEELLDLNLEDWNLYCAISKRAIDSCMHLMSEYRNKKNS